MARSTISSASIRMANYNTFLVAECKTGKIVLVTSSARKAQAELCKGHRVEVWNANKKVETIYSRTKGENRPLWPYIEAEREYIRLRQEKATQRNVIRTARRL